MMNDENTKAIYIVLGKACQVNCPFCFNKFDPEFEDRSSRFENADQILEYMEQIDPKSVTFIGGETFLPRYCGVISTVLLHYKDKEPIYWCASSNLAYDKFEDIQIEAMRTMQEMSTDDIAIGSSYSLDRFQGQEEYFTKWKKNMLYLESIGIDIGVTLTITLGQLKQSVDETLDLLINKVHSKSINIERCVFPRPTTEKRVKELEEFYKRSDEYMKELFEKCPKELNRQLERYVDAYKYQVPIFNNYCSHTVDTLYPENGEAKLRKGCICNSVGTDMKLHIDKLHKLDCFSCEYFMYCKGDCECNRFACAFPKKTFEYIKTL